MVKDARVRACCDEESKSEGVLWWGGPEWGRAEVREAGMLR